MPCDDSLSEPEYCDHSTCGWKPRDEPKPCTCGPDEACGDPCTPEPPLTSEEEEEAPPVCGHPECPWNGPCYQAPKEVLPPPQPVRRPPNAVAYSVQGHLYEVALSGDATVRAVDGALVIQHHLGPVAGIVQVRPMFNEGGASGAEADQ